MRTTDITSTAISNLRRNKTRSILTILAVFIGATTLTLTNGIGDGIKTYLDRQISSLGASGFLITSVSSEEDGTESDSPIKYDETKTRSEPSVGPQAPGSGGASGLSPFLLTSDDLKTIASIDGVESVTPATSLSIDYIQHESSEKYQINTQTLGNDFLTFDIAEGSQLDANTKDYQILLPSSYVNPLGFSDAADTINANVQLQVTNQQQESRQFTAKVVGVVNSSLFASDSMIPGSALADDAIAFQQIGTPPAQQGVYSAAITQYQDGLSEDEVITLKENLSNAGFTGITIEDQQQTVFAVIDAIVLVLNLFGIVTLAAASFGIVNTLFMAVQERTKEIGLMKAVGLSRRKIFALFSLEASMLGLIGSTLGVLTAMLIGVGINSVASTGVLASFEGLQLLSFSPTSIATIILLITGIAFLAGTLPARKASKLDAIEALRYE